jgi:PAS domain S-box-containing protein
MPESKESFHTSLNLVKAKILLDDEMLMHVVLIQNGEIVHVNGYFSAMFGFSPEEMLGKKLEEYIVNGQYGEGMDVWNMLAPGETGRLRLIGLHADGRRFHFEMLATCKIEKNGFYYMVTSWSDLSAYIQESRATKEIEERFRAAFHYAAVGMALLSVSGRFLDVNYALCEMLGRSSTELEQMSILECMYPENHEEYLDNSTRLLISEISSYETELRCKHPEGLSMWGLLNVTLVRDEDGKPLYFIIQLQDITKRKEAEELLRKSDKLSAVGQLAAGVAHEVRNPLTVLKGFTQMLHSADKKNAHYYQLMLSEVDRIESIIGEFLLLARPQETQFRNHELRSILQDVITLMDTKAVMNKVILHPVISDGLPEIECDANQLKQVFINIIQNAIEAMPQGGTITIEAKPSLRDTVSVRITDEGCGIPAERIDKLGEPFYSSKEKGTGLGLMICYQIIGKHKGRILITSKVNIGTTFEIQMPIRQSFHA